MIIGAVNNDFNYDGVLKDMFQEDRPVLLDELTGGIAVTEFLNVELPKVLEWRLDLVMRLADGYLTRRFAPIVTPPHDAIVRALEALLAAQKTFFDRALREQPPSP